MGWVRIDDNAPHHKKMLQAGPAACWLWVCGLAYCQRMSTDGLIPIEALPSLGVGHWKACARQLESAGLWHVVDAGYEVHDYLSWNATKEERQEKLKAHRDRTAKWRDGKRDASPPVNGDAPVTRHTESGVTLLLSSPSPLHSTPDLSVPTNRSDLVGAVPVTPRARAISGAGMTPLEWYRKHESVHVAEFCDFVCFPNDLADGFAKKITGVHFVEARDQVLVWAREVRQQWQGRIVPDGSDFDFWRHRWTESHGGSKPAVTAAFPSVDLDKFRPKGA